MTITVNEDALAHAEKLIESGDVAHDERDDWSEHAPGSDDENRFIDREGWSTYSTWYLGIAAQHDHDDIARAAKRLLEKIDADHDD